MGDAPDWTAATARRASVRSRVAAVVAVGWVSLNAPVGAASTAPVAPDAEGVVDFTTPSNNIECTFIPPGGTSVYKPPRNEAEISCDRARPTYIHVSIGAHGPATLIRDPGEQPCCGDVPVLSYGKSLRMGPFACVSEPAGLTCKRDDGAGFVLSRAKAETF